jgi:hypothetical protein
MNLKFLLKKWEYDKRVGFIIANSSVMTETFDCIANRSSVSCSQAITLKVHCT